MADWSDNSFDGSGVWDSLPSADYVDPWLYDPNTMDSTFYGDNYVPLDYSSFWNNDTLSNLGMSFAADPTAYLTQIGAIDPGILAAFAPLGTSDVLSQMASKGVQVMDPLNSPAPAMADQTANQGFKDAFLNGEVLGLNTDGTLQTIYGDMTPDDFMQRREVLASHFKPQVMEDPIQGILQGLNAKSAREPGLYDSSMKNIGGGLSVMQAPEGLRTYSTLGMGDGEGPGMHIEGAPNRANSLSDVKLLGQDGTLEDWAKNSDKTWQQYARAQGYDPVSGNSYQTPGFLSKAAAMLKGLTGGGSGGRSANGSGSTIANSSKAGAALAGGASLAGALAQALGVFQGPKTPPKPIDSRGADAWRVSRAAGSGRKNLAGGGLAEVARSRRVPQNSRAPQGGQSDKVPAMLSPDEYVVDADVVSALGDGSPEAGAAQLDQMRENIRAHKRSAPNNKIPPKAKSPMAYLSKGKK